MKFIGVLALLLLLVAVFSIALAQNKEETVYRRSALADRIHTPPHSFGSFGQPSSAYPSYAYPTYPGFAYPHNQFSNGYPDINSYPNINGNPNINGYPNHQMASASGHYPTYAQLNGPQATDSAQSLDIHQVLDELIRSAGLSPQGDHSPQALQSKGDSFAKSGTSRVFSFKKLYSFPFYLSNDQSAVEGYGFQIPFLKRYISRMSPKMRYKKRYN